MDIKTSESELCKVIEKLLGVRMHHPQCYGGRIFWPPGTKATTDEMERMAYHLRLNRYPGPPSIELWRVYARTSNPTNVLELTGFPDEIARFGEWVASWFEAIRLNDPALLLAPPVPLSVDVREYGFGTKYGESVNVWTVTANDAATAGNKTVRERNPTKNTIPGP